MKVHVITLGCPKNAVDSEGMTGILETQGHVLVGAADQADVVIVNTCSFIASARDETLDIIAFMKQHRQQTRTMRLRKLDDRAADLPPPPELQ